jgi:hypothetical protein
VAKMSEGREMDLESGKKKVHVTINKGTDKAEIERLKTLLEQRDKVIEGYAQELFEEEKNKLKERYPEHRDRIESIEKPSELEFAQAFLTAEKPRKPSSGSVRLRQPQSNNPMQREFETPLEMVRYVYDNASNPNSPYYNQMKNVRKELRSKFNLDDFPKTTEMYSDRIEEMATQELGKNFGYEAYTEWIQEKAREGAKRK